MAKIIFTDNVGIKDGQSKLSSVSALYNGSVFSLDVYGGDTRTDAVKSKAIRDYLSVIVSEDAQLKGKPPPEKDPV